MPLRPFRCLFLGLLAACGSGDAPQPAAAERAARGERPNIVLVSIDSLRPDHLGCYAYDKPTSPTIDRFASEGVRFATAVSTTSWTLPAHAALFTGLFDSAHGLVDNGLALASGHHTLAETLRGAGYRTAGFFGGPYLHPTFGLDQGFEHYQSCMSTFGDDVDAEELRGAVWLGQDPSHHDVTGPRTVKEITSWVERAGDEPFFLFVHLWDVHYDYLAPESYVRAFDPDYEGALDGRDFMKNPAVAREMAPRDYQHLMALYDAEIRYTDDTLKEIVGVLEAHAKTKNTLLVITADHGEEFFEHGQKGHQKSLYEEVVRVPLVFHWPGRFPPGAVVEQQVRLVDLMPTLLDLAGVPLAAAVQGRSLKPLLRGEELVPEPALCELLVDRRDMRALRTDALKIITSRKGEHALWFDLAHDLRELRPLEKESQSAGKAFDHLERSTRAVLEFGAKLGLPPEKVEVDRAMLERLKSLGYTGK